MRGRFLKVIVAISYRKTWLNLLQGKLKSETERLLVAAQDQAIWTNWIKAKIDKIQVDPNVCDVHQKRELLLI